MNRIPRSHGTAGSLGAKPRNVPTWQMTNACLEALERDGGNRLGEEEEVEEVDARTEFPEEETESLQARRERWQKAAPLAVGL